MNAMNLDPQYISETVKLMRHLLNLTQENLADAANISTRTVEKIESGRHRPSEQTLRRVLSD